MLTPVRVPGRGPSPRLALGLVAIVAVGIVGLGVLGRDAERPLPEPSAAAAPTTTPGDGPRPTPTAGSSPLTSPTQGPAIPEGVVAIRRTAAEPLRESAALRPTGLRTIGGNRATTAATQGRDGALWLAASGSLTRLDLTTGAHRTWSLDDDERFLVGLLSPARDGGVWVVGALAVRRFDASGFAGGYRLPRQPIATSEDVDGTLWVACSDGSVVGLRGEEARWILDPAPTAEFHPASIAVDASGGVWLGGFDGPSFVTVVARFDGRTWTRRGERWAGSNRLFSPIAISVLRDGAAWVVARQTITRYEGATADTVAPDDFRTPTSVALSAAGDRWISYASDPEGAVLVRRLAQDGTATEWKAAGRSYGGDGRAWVFADQGRDGRRVVLVTAAGVFRFGGARWRRILATEDAAGSVTRLVGIDPSRAIATEGAWILSVWDGHATARTRPGPTDIVLDIARDPQGRTWAAMADGLYRRDATTWTPVRPGHTISITPDPAGAVATVRIDSSGEPRLVHYAADGTAVEVPLTDQVLIAPSPSAVGADGTTWIGTSGAWGPASGLVAYRDGVWRVADIRGGALPVVVAGLAATPSGEVWALVADAGGSRVSIDGPLPERAAWIARLRDGRWSSWAIADAWPRWGVGPRISAATDGSVWIATDHGLLNTDGDRWRRFASGLSFDAVAVSPDGTLWVAGPAGIGTFSPDAAPAAAETTAP